MTRKIVKKVLRYNAVFDPCDEGGFMVTVPKLPGLVTEGDTFEEALKRAEKAISGYLLVLQEDGEELPDSDEQTFMTPIEIQASSLGLAA